MVDAFDRNLNEILVDTFYTILKVQEKAIQYAGQANLSMSEIHLMEIVAKSPEGRTISCLAQELDVTLPSVTVAINKLVKKGYVHKFRGKHDGRTVCVTLTPEGKKMDDAHQYFHTKMIESVSGTLNHEEKQVLSRCIEKLNRFFKQYDWKMEAT